MTLLIAERGFSVTGLRENHRLFFRQYLSSGVPDVHITITPEDIAFESRKAAREDALEGRTARYFPESQLETTAILRKVTEALFAYDTLLFHGSVVAVDGEAYLFTAKSGTGKSTHTRLWREIFGDRAVMVNDDKPFLRLTETEVLACGSPWMGKHGLGSNMQVPLKAICILDRGTVNRIRPITPAEAMPMLFQQSQRPMSREYLPRYMALIDALVNRVPMYKMNCDISHQAAQMAYAAMSGEGENKK